jgi:hypothetical protein
MKNHPVATEMFHAYGERRTGRHDADFINFSDEPKFDICKLFYPLRTRRIRVI